MRLIVLEERSQLGVRNESKRLTKNGVKRSPIQLAVKRHRQGLAPGAFNGPLDFDVAAVLRYLIKSEAGQDREHFRARQNSPLRHYATA
jgi:hypothetical protein